MDELKHYGVLGMKWGHTKRKIEATAYSIGAKINPREAKYKARKVMNRVSDSTKLVADATTQITRSTGKLPTSKKALKAVESVGIDKHKKAVYDNLDDTDLKRFKKYTDSARYSRSVNSFLAIGTPKDYAAESADLKQSLRKNRISDQTVYRSCNMKFSTNGLAKKLDKMGEDELQRMCDSIGKNFNGKKMKENRVFSTSTSPLFAIDTWRAVNPTAASTYNTYMVINCKNTPGVYADGRTKKGKSLVNTRSNQECILAPDKLVYRNVTFDEKRKMFAITVDAIGE